MSPLSISSTLTLPNKAKIPQLGFGVYKSPTDICVKSCTTALNEGYRHIDTAQYYENEAEVGEAVKESDIPRKDIFVTTKVLKASGSVEKTYQKCIESVEKLDPETGYVDLFLIHSPSSGPDVRKEMWQALEKLYDQGKAKSIGVSNFGIQHIEELKGFAKVWPPHVNQIELHPWLQQREIVDYCNKHGIIIEAYCPLVRNTKADDPQLNKIAKKHHVTTGQVLIRYCLEKGWVPLPKSDNKDRIKANADVYGFQLEKDELAELDSLDQGDKGAIVMAVSN